jgi:hypothetical protein
MASAPDIITYIGVPLAVLGVAPILYNTISTIVTVMKVKRMLHCAHLTGLTRGDVINHVIEVELPRYTIAPLPREENTRYWELYEHPSRIPGGTWTIFNWQSHKIGLKTQRIDYTDQLRQPQAEIGFEELISFLIDLGAVPDPNGFRMLRGSGLWVPIGTPLLLSPDRHENVLTIAPLDDSDGNLSLAVAWSSNWGVKDQSTLPPHWAELRGTFPARLSTNVVDSETGPLKGTTEESVKTGDRAVLKTAKYTPAIVEALPAIRCHVGFNGLIAAIPDDFDSELENRLYIGHLEVDDMNINTTGVCV